MAKISTLVDPFVSTALNTNLWNQFTAGGATFTYGNGCTVNYPASATSSTDGDLSSSLTYDLTASSAFLEVLSVPNAGTNADAAFELRVDANNMFLFEVEASAIYAQYLVGGARTTLNSVLFNPVTQKWWRIREAAGTIYWEVSSDGLTWSIYASVANPLVITALTVVISGTCYQNETNAGAFTWMNLNTPSSEGPYNHLRVADGMSRSEVAN